MKFIYDKIRALLNFECGDQTHYKKWGEIRKAL